MERKIGEIFEYNGEWYQCIELSNCVECAFNGKSKAVCPPCEELKREDGKEVIFKKLEKVGDLVVKEGRIFQCLNSHYISCIGCVFKETTKYCDKDHYLDGPCLNNEIWVEKKQNKVNKLKQNRKNMEENLNDRTNCAQCGDKRFEVIARAKADLLKSTNIERDEKEMAVIDNILFRCAQIGWLEKYEKEVEKMDLKPFDLEKAKAGKLVCTRDGRKARIICFDKKNDYYPIIALVETEGKECIFQYTSNGEYLEGNENNSHSNLVMLPEKKEGWTNLFKSSTYSTKEEAMKYRNKCNDYIDTIKISWEE